MSNMNPTGAGSQTGNLRSSIPAYPTKARVRQPASTPGLVWDMPGFGPMTRISTTFGDVPAQALRVRDTIRTRTGECLQIQWLDRIILNEEFMQRHPEANPILIRASAMAVGLPGRDVMVSPGQAVCFSAHVAAGDFKAAGTLTGRPNIMRKPEPIITYTLFHCGRPVEVKVEGIWARVAP